MNKPLFKTTIVIWSDYNPQHVEIATLAKDASEGDAYCSHTERILVDDPASDPHWDGTEFFDND